VHTVLCVAPARPNSICTRLQHASLRVGRVHGSRPPVPTCAPAGLREACTQKVRCEGASVNASRALRSGCADVRFLCRTAASAAIFERRKEYGVAVWMSRHPELNDCIFEVSLVAATRTLRAAEDPAHMRASLAGLAGALMVCRCSLTPDRTCCEALSMPSCSCCWMAAQARRQ